MTTGKTRLILAGLLLAATAAGAMHFAVNGIPKQAQLGDALSFATPATAAGGTAAASGDLFAPVAEVLRHPRCMNCHPVDDRPRQGEDRHPHLQNVVRGPDNLGFVNMRCTSCHREENNEATGVPGAPTWHLAPASMGWQGLNDAQLCTTLKDEKRNGGKSIAALVEHMEKDKLVLWGWAPGSDRAPVPVPHEKFMTQLKTWAAANAPCPS